MNYLKCFNLRCNKIHLKVTMRQKFPQKRLHPTFLLIPDCLLPHSQSLHTCIHPHTNTFLLTTMYIQALTPVWLHATGVDGSVLSICREFLSNRRPSRGWWCCQSVDPNHTGVPKEVYWVSFVNPIHQRNVWTGGERTICLCRWLHTTGSCSQASRQNCCCNIP